MADLNAQEVLVGNANGAGLWIAPVGTALPTDTNTLPEAWKPLGYTTDDGVEQMMDMETTDIMTWQDKSPVRTVTKSKVFSYKFMLLQWNARTLALYMGTPEPTPDQDGGFTLNLSADDVPTEHALVVDVNDAGTKARFALYRTTLASVENLTLKQGEAAPLGVTVKALAVDGKTGSVIYKPTPAQVAASQKARVSA